MGRRLLIIHLLECSRLPLCNLSKVLQSSRSLAWVAAILVVAARFGPPPRARHVARRIANSKGDTGPPLYGHVPT